MNKVKVMVYEILAVVTVEEADEIILREVTVKLISRLRFKVVFRSIVICS